MKKFEIVERKTMNAGVAVEIENGKFEVTVEGNTKTVAASTFKRWYKVTAEITEEENNVEEISIKVGSEVEEQPKAEEVKPEIKVGDYVGFEANPGVVSVGIVTDVNLGLATVLSMVEGEIEDRPVRVEELENIKRDAAEKEFEKLEKALNPEPVQEEKPKKAPKTPKAPRKSKASAGWIDQEATEERVENGDVWSPSGVIETIKSSRVAGGEVKMIDRTIGDFKSKGKIYPKYFDTFEFYGFTLQVTYIHIWGSTKVELYDKDGTVLYKAPTGALKPLFEFLEFDAETQKEIKNTIRDERKNWVTTQEVNEVEAK